MQYTQFKGTTVAMVTPFTATGEIDEPNVKKLIDFHIENGTDVILACGTTGESATMSYDEHQHMMELVVNYTNKRCPVMVGAGSNSTHEAVMMTKHAERHGADCVLSVGPYYNKPTQEGFYQHFKAIAESTSLPIILYNVPGRTGSNITAATTLRLAEIPNIIGVKEASGNMSQIMEILRRRPKDFLVLSGDDSLTLPLLAVGLDGIISVVANETPALLHDMVHSAFAGNWEKARKIHFKLLPLMETNFIESNPIPAKTALAMMGMIEDNFRSPLVKMSEGNKAILRKVLQDLELVK
ncbi:4-hydroxy-tetrahydrodipicolinate synthase [candidate division KSB1 bacterium]|nr:4-hydroxy-tetrahydrodipicolinate synthase [candidate division KSB1 bacterium]